VYYLLNIKPRLRAELTVTTREHWIQHITFTVETNVADTHTYTV